MPALIYLIYSTSHVIIDTYKGLYNTAFIKIFQTILFTFLLNILCQNGLGLVSWLIVSIPFVLMTVIASVLLLVFGLNPATGKAVSTVQTPATAPTPAPTPAPTTTSTPAPTPAPTTTSTPAPTTAPTTASTVQTTVAGGTITSPAPPSETPPSNYAVPITVEGMTPFHGVLGKGPRPSQSNTI